MFHTFKVPLNQWVHVTLRLVSDPTGFAPVTEPPQLQIFAANDLISNTPDMSVALGTFASSK